MAEPASEGDAGSPQGFPGAAAATTGYMPTQPVMGGVQKQSDTSNMAWTGGKPRVGWTELEDPNPSSIIATQIRSPSVSLETKALHHRTTGLEPKFTRESDLLTFQKKMMDHMIRYGMDTITYLPDPTDPKQVISVLSEHAQFTLKEAKTSEKRDHQDFYDQYDHANIRDSKTFLLNSLDEAVLTQMYENCDDDETFIVHWMNLMLIVGSISIERFDRIKDSIKARKIQNYAGEDVESISTDYVSEWKRLHGARMYDHGLTLTMLKTIMESGNEDFRYGLRALKDKLNKKLMDVRHMSYDQSHKAMVQDELDVQSVLKLCKQEYRILLDDGKWPAASHAKDSKAIGRSYGNVNAVALNEDRVKQLLANALSRINGDGARDKSSDKCRLCGENGHWARDCPKKGRDNQRNGDQRNNGRRPPFQNRNSASRPQGNNRERRQRFPPPMSGESEIKTVGDKKYYWCSKCNNWMVSHGTSTHKTNEELRASMAEARAGNNNRANNHYDFDMHPSAFMLICGPTSLSTNDDSLTEDIESEIRMIESTGHSAVYVPISMSVTTTSLDKHRYILFDSGANCCISNERSDFVGKYHKFRDGRIIEGMGKALSADGHGQVAWTFLADDGSHRTLELPAYHIGSIQQKIASTSQILKVYPKERVHISSEQLQLTGDESKPSITVPICPTTSLPLAVAQTVTAPIELSKRRTVQNPLATLRNTPSLTEGANFNLSEPAKELLRWHYRLAHLNQRRIQWMFKRGFLASSEKSRRAQAEASLLDSGPLCTACQYAKQRRKTTPGSVKRAVPTETGLLKRDRLFPGQQISVDHFHSKPHGRLLNTYGKEAMDKKYTGGCIFVDHSSNYIHVELQSHLNTHETLKAKIAFETMCSGHGVIIQEYLSDNGTAFRNKDFEAHLQQFRQTIRHAGVGAHHSNGIAERAISTVMSISRAMLHHSAIHWPDIANVELWSLAVLHAVYVLNRVPREDSGLSPLELFTRATSARSKLFDLHVWGAPAYVLDDTLADGKKLPRWKPRGGRHLYVGSGAIGNAHSHSIPLILSLDTGKITHQYHVVFDDWFSTVNTTDADQINFDHDDWYRTFGLTEYQYVTDDHPSPVLPSLDQRETAERREELAQLRALPPPSMSYPPTTPVVPNFPQPEVAAPAPPLVDPPRVQPPSLETASTNTPSSSPQREMTQVTTPVTTTAPPARPVNAPRVSLPRAAQPELRRSKRLQTDLRRSERIQNRNVLTATEGMTDEHLYTIMNASVKGEIANNLTMFADMGKAILVCDESEETHGPVLDPLMSFWAQAFAAGTPPGSKPDTFRWDDILRMEDKAEWLEAAKIEIEALEAHGAWVEDLKSNATTKIIPGQWVFVYKRNPDGTIKKRKARWVLRGDLQDYEGDTFSPVASWPTVRSFLIVSSVLNRVTCTIDFSNAFIQSSLPPDEALWVHPPRGYQTVGGSDHCLRMVKSQYGIRSAPKLWFQHISRYFKKLGLKQSQYDPCLWYGRKIMLVQYVDDCGISAPTQGDIDQFITDLRKEDLMLTQEESFAEFLGIKFTVVNGVHEMTQKGLIKKILEAADMTDCNPNSLPTSQTPLGADKEGAPMKESWNYRSLVGMLLYLSGNTRPDIVFAVSQVARFSNNPKQSHATAMKTILRYLKGTMDKGVIVRPKDGLDTEMDTDADFCGLFGEENPRDQESVKSRSGINIMVGGFPLFSKSVLQTHISQSTMEAEYSALSQGLRYLLPIKWLLEEMIAELGGLGLPSTTVRATVFEDNQSAYFLATNHRLTSRTKYYLAKWHWFWAIYDEGRGFTIKKCTTDEQRADWLTKPLGKIKFEANRMAVIGW
jgi:hypothetical protein